MKFIFLTHPPHLPKKWTIIYHGRVSGLATKTTQKARSEYLRKNNSWKHLKNWLSNISHGKCWYCEAKAGRAPFDVDHFRPKLRITVDGVRLAGDFGYYWIAYEWWNFRLSCQRCNRPEGDEGGAVYGKANEFPLKDEGTRCNLPEASFSNEAPRLLDPCDELDCRLLAHTIDGEVKPAADGGTWEFERARYTITQLGFNAFNSPESKKRSWGSLDLLIRLGGDHPDVVQSIKQHLSGEQEHWSFFRSAIGTHRDKPWVEALL
ncbi:hypothetical protein GOL24_10795 [Sinorhizobium medicae]|nr:hypothetical protein [Sinorhizobium medicae]